MLISVIQSDISPAYIYLDTDRKPVIERDYGSMSTSTYHGATHQPKRYSSGPGFLYSSNEGYAINTMFLRPNKTTDVDELAIVGGRHEVLVVRDCLTILL